ADVDEGASRPEDARRLGEHGGVVVDVGVDHQPGDGVELAVPERELRRVCLDELDVGTAAGDPQLIGRDVDARHRPAELLEEPDVRPAPAAEIEQAPLPFPQQLAYAPAHAVGPSPPGPRPPRPAPVPPALLAPPRPARL